MSTALTVYTKATSATTITTANTLISTSGANNQSSTATNIATNTGWGQVYAQGTSNAWAAAGSIGSPDGHGWLWDVTTLEGQQILSGNWSGAVVVDLISGGSIVADFVIRAYKRSSGGTYTALGSITLSGKTITGSISVNSVPATSFAAMSFATGDKLYIDLWANITTPTNIGGNYIEVYATGTSFGGTNITYLATPGYAVPITTSTRTVPASAALKGTLKRTTPASAALKSLGLSRTVPASAALTYRFTRTVPASSALKSTLTRTTPASAALKSLGLTRTTPASGSLKSVGLTRTVPVSAILAFMGTGMGSPYPWNYIKQQLVKVYDRNGNFLDVWRDAPLLDGFKAAIQSATTPMRVKLPRRFDNFDEVGTVGTLGSIAQGNTVKWYLFGPGLPAAGMLRYQGVIDAYEPTIDASGEEYVTVTVTPRGSSVGDASLIGSLAFGTVDKPATYIDPIQMFNWFFNNTDPLTGLAYTYPLTLDPTNPTTSGVSTQYTFINQQLRDIWDTILLLLPQNWYWRVNIDNTVTLNVAPVTAQNSFILGRHCVSLSYTKDWTQLKNVVFIQGGNNPNTGLAISAHKQGSDISTYGPRYLLLNESRIVDQNTANNYAAGLLTINDRVQFRAQVRIFDYRGDPNVGLGYDIETIRVGQTCTVIAPQITTSAPTPPSYWDSGFVWDNNYWDANPATAAGGTSYWDQMLWDQGYWDFSPSNSLGQVVEIAALSYHFDYVDLELVALRPSQDVALAHFQARLQSNALSTTTNVAVWG